MEREGEGVTEEMFLRAEAQLIRAAIADGTPEVFPSARCPSVGQELVFLAGPGTGHGVARPGVHQQRKPAQKRS